VSTFRDSSSAPQRVDYLFTVSHVSLTGGVANVWLQTLALPEEFKNAKPKRMRQAFLNAPAKVVNHARGITLRLSRTYAYYDAFVEALARIRRLPYFA